MGGTLDWFALPVLIELYGIDDPETVIITLMALRQELSTRARLEAQAQAGK